ncbi:MAG: TonB-dependent receptor [Phycisphaerales bacterium]|nr:TonB-dependent receptor [Phycisphaerales bacterium]
MIRFLLNSMFILLCYISNSQTILITGKVEDSTHSPIMLASVSVTHGTASTLTNIDGVFTIPVSFKNNQKQTLTVSIVNYESKVVKIDQSTVQHPITITLNPLINTLDNTIVETSKGASKSITNTPTPIQVYSSHSFTNQGAITLEQALNYAIPSYNATRQTNADLSSTINAFELRNLGSSRTLVLINGKRKNLSAFLFTENGLSKGEGAVDISMLPMMAIKKIEVLPDGACAQYGSDAIAGVLNIILKDSLPNYMGINLFNGVSYKGDGISYGANINSGLSLNKKGFLNYTINFSTAGLTNRATNIDPNADFQEFANTQAPYTLDSVINYLRRTPTGNQIVGNAPTTIIGGLLNGSYPINKTVSLYFMGNYSYKKTQVYGNYRQPYWQQDTNFLVHPVGSYYNGFISYANNYESDFTGSFGIQTHSSSEWDIDISTTIGGNTISTDYLNSLNYSLGKNSPTNFYLGGYGFFQWVINADVVKKLTKFLTLSFGSELRTEKYTITQGDSFSYSGLGANGYPGIYPQNAVISNRYNAGLYGIINFNIANKLIGEVSGRYENYSDFGNALVGKVSLLYKAISHILAIRGSVSNGFKAPTLQQYYFSTIQATFTSNAGVSRQAIYNNYNVITKQLGIPNLKAEKSLDYSIGLTINPINNFHITIDYYNITIRDRVILSSNIVSNDPSSIIYTILQQYNLSSMNFFINTVATNTSGVDINANYNNIIWGRTRWTINWGFNYNRNKNIGSLTVPPILAASGSNLFNRADESFLLTSRPIIKSILGVNFNYNRLNITTTLTYFGKNKFVSTTMPMASNAATDPLSYSYPFVEFMPKVVTDLSLSYEFTKYMELNFVINNLFNVIPQYRLRNIEGYNERDIKNAINFNGRYSITTREGAHFDYNGTGFLTTIKFKIM